MSDRLPVNAPVQGKMKPALMILIFSLLLMGLIGFGAFFDVASGIGFFYIIVTAYFNALIVLTPIIRIKKFGVGAALYLPGAVLGLLVEYYMEMVVNPVLKSYWCVAAYAAFFILSGLAADFAYRFLPRRLRGARRAAAAGIVLMVVHFFLMFLGALFFYRPQPAPTPPAQTLVSILPWAVPWLIVNAGFGGYTAFALAGRDGHPLTGC